MTVADGGILRGDAVFGSVDSLPGQLAVAVSPLRAPALILLFSLLAALQLGAFELGLLDRWFPARDYVFGPFAGQHALSVRAYILSFYLAFSTFAAGPIRARILLALDLVLRFLVMCALLDLGSTALMGFLGQPYPLSVIQIIAGIVGFATFAFALITRGSMPAPVPVAASIGRQGRRGARITMRIAATTTVAAVAAIWTGFNDPPIVIALRRLTLLGGIGPGVVAFFFLFFLQLYILAAIDRRRWARRDFAAPISVIVPAHNESYIIAETIRHIDAAAANYPNTVELVIIDNASTDGTGDLARAVIAACTAIEGQVIEVPRPGKAHALNAGVALVRHAYIVRIDADTLVHRSSFRLAMQSFASPETGAVGGVPFPPGGGPFDGSRLVEVLLKHGYYSPALSAVSGLVGIPGMFAIYRREALERVGPFPAGMNGEDTDVSLRIGELGYRTIVDGRVRYISEVPTSLAHLREQRLRWFRSIYHVSARARSLILSRRISVRGKLVLPYMLLNNARRAMMVPIVIFGLFQLVFGHASDNPLIWQSVVAVLIGAPILNAMLAIAVTRQPRALLSLPSYIVFRAMRSWYTLESALSIPINQRRTLVTLPATGHALAFFTDVPSHSPPSEQTG